MRTALIYLGGVAAIVVTIILGTISIVEAIREMDDLEGID